MSEMVKRLICTDQREWEDELRLEICVEDSIEERYIDKALFESLFGIEVGNGMCIEIDVEDVTERQLKLCENLLVELKEREVMPEEWNNNRLGE